MTEQQELWRPVGNALQAIDQADRQSPRRRVLILGAGISGLTAAYELTRRGHQVEILEATADRVGGRLWTWRSDDGRFSGERAAMRIPSPHDYTFHYVRLVNLESQLGPFVNTEQLWAVGGETYRACDYSKHVYPLFEPHLRPDERPYAEENPGGLLEHYMTTAMGSLTPRRQKALLAGDFSDSVLAQMDRISWHAYLRGVGASPGALDLLGRVLGIAAVWDWSLAALLRDGLHQQNATYQRISGGFDQLPNRLYQELRRNHPELVQFNQQILDIDAGRRVVRIRDRKTGVERDKGFQHLLVTLPFPVLKDMRLNGFSRAKTEAIRGMQYASACKDLLAYEERFWEQDGVLGGRSRSDGPDQNVHYFREAYYPMDRLPAEKTGAQIGLSFETEDGGQLSGMFGLYIDSPAPALERATVDREAASTPATLLGAYTLNEGARTLQAMTAEERREAVLSSLEKVHGSVVRTAVHFQPWSWDLYPWARGALGITPPNFLVDHLVAAKRAEHGAHFAGEHLSIAPGWIQGSLESTLREVEAILRSRADKTDAAEEDLP